MDEDEVYIITIDDTTEKVSLFADSGGVTSFKGRIGAVVPTAGDYTTDQVTEANNLYYTEARVTDNASVQANTAKVSSKFEDGTDPLDAVYMNGNVGIGTTTPDTKLTLVTTDYIVADLSRSSGGNAYISIQDGTTSDKGFVGFGANGNDLLFRSGNIEHGRLKDNGNFGIGTTTPSEKLDVNGNIVVSGTGNFANGLELSASGADRRIGNTVDNRSLFFLGGSDSSGGGAYIRLFGSDFGGTNNHGGIAMSTTNGKPVTINNDLELGGKIKATSINFSGLPTSTVGLSTGDVWNDSGTLKIV